MSEQPQPFRGPVERPAVGATDEEEIAAARAANRFDIRRIIGALFCIYAIVLIVVGVAGNHVVKTKAAGVNVDLWTGFGMLIVGALMIAWALLRPVKPEPPESRGEGSGRIRRAPAT